jgi:hypothetical protein
MRVWSHISSDHRGYLNSSSFKPLYCCSNKYTSSVHLGYCIFFVGELNLSLWVSLN